MMRASRKLIVFGLLVVSISMSSVLLSEIGWTAEEKHTFTLSHIEMFEPFTVAKEGKSEGFAVDIITEALARVNLKVLFKGVQQEKEVDFVLNGQADGTAFEAIGPDTQKIYDFSDPYLITGGAFFVKSPNPTSSDPKEFERKTVASPATGPLAGYIQHNFPNVIVLSTVKDYKETLKAVLDGKADAAALNTQTGAALAGKLYPGKFSMPERGFLEVPVGIGVPKGKNGDLLTKFNVGLKEILADGTYDKLLEKWGLPSGATKPSTH
jgi:ABC-type amino acid transport substrate-binding protein